MLASNTSSAFINKRCFNNDAVLLAGAINRQVRSQRTVSSVSPNLYSSPPSLPPHGTPPHRRPRFLLRHRRRPPPKSPAARAAPKSTFSHILALHLDARLTDLSVSGATISNMIGEPQIFFRNHFEPQIESVPTDADIVTVTAGGNDLCYIGDMFGHSICAYLSGGCSWALRRRLRHWGLRRWQSGLWKSLTRLARRRQMREFTWASTSPCSVHTLALGSRRCVRRGAD
jgi:hypothetical protein